MPDCLWCNEPILDHEARVPLNNDTAWEHMECFIRSVMGSLGHQMHQCPCYGQFDKSEIRMSRRECARQAFVYWHLEQMRLDSATRDQQDANGRGMEANPLD